MDNNKQQKNYSGAGNSKTSNQASDSNRHKKSSDIQANKYWPRNCRRRENSATYARNNNNSNNKQQQLPAKVRPNVDKRPGDRGYNSHSTGSSYHTANEDYFAASTGLVSGDRAFNSSFKEERYGHNYYELNSVYSPGSKKQSFNHLLNFHYTPREVDLYDRVSGANVNNQRYGRIKKHKYNKEQFLQANFQFVIKASAKRKTDDSPDKLIDWSLIEQINIQTPNEPQCPICLYPPVAAKVTRCGHVYCWPCVLHYLSLSEKTWNKCPICYDAIHIADLKSASIIQQQDFKINSKITFRLMRREKNSLFIETYDNKKAEQQTVQKYPYVSSPQEEKLFSKFLLATRNDVFDILAREKRELQTDDDDTGSEYEYIQQARELLKQRTEKLGEHKEGESYKLAEEITENVAHNDESVSIIENTEFIVHNDIKDNEVINRDGQSSFETETSESSNTEAISVNEISPPSLTNKKLSNNFYYFYQSDDGQNIYLHTLNVKMLKACYGSLADAPSVITAQIFEKKQHSMDDEYRRKFRCLAHLPLTCQFSVVLIDLQPPYITKDIRHAFEDEFKIIKKERQRKDIEELKRERHIYLINERQMGKIIASTANINLTSSHEFPTCGGFEEPLVQQTCEIDVMDNFPSTSKGCRTKTVSTSSASSCSYSAIASHCKQDHNPWSTLNAAQAAKSLTVTDQAEMVDGEGFSTINTNLSDFVDEALSQKKDKKSSTIGNQTLSTHSNKSVGTKKSKKSKKMLPLYSNGMNFSGN